MHLPDFSYEKKLWRKGYKLIIGVDEVGRGAFAGPVVAAAAAFKNRLKTSIKKHEQILSDLESSMNNNELAHEQNRLREFEKLLD